MLDYVIRSGTLIDGSGGPARRADVGIRDGRIVAVGQVDEEAETEFDATGLTVIPGVVDPHTHYDAQLFWDPAASPSNVHGVTTVIGGNCGFTLAPLNAEDADYIRRMMAKVEGMPLAALEQGVPWTWSTFAEYLDALEGRLGVNAGFLVGHCALRRKVMGAARSEEVATDEEIAAMRELLAESLEAGGLGFSSSQSRTHSDGEGRPITSRHADRREMLGFCEVVAAHEGTTLEYITNGCLDSFSPEEIDLMTTMSVTAQRPLNWNVLTVDARAGERIEHQLSASTAAAAAGGRIVALTMPTLVPMNMSFRTHCALFLIPGWGEVMGLPEAERMRQLADPAVRGQARRARPQQRGGCFPRPLPLGDLRDRRHLLARQRGLRVPHASPTSRPSAARPRSTRCSTSCWPTTCARSCGLTPTTATRPRGSCGPASGTTRGPWSAGRTPEPTWTACAGPTTRPRSSVTACGGAGWCPWSRRST